MIAQDRNLNDVRFPVQWVIRPMSDSHHDYRGYAGQVAGGVICPGAEIVVLPGGQRTTVASIDTFDGEIEAAFPTMSVALRFTDEIDVSRGDMIVEADDQPITARELEAHICWMSDQPLAARGQYAIKHTTRSARAIVERDRAPHRHQHARARQGRPARASTRSGGCACAAARRWWSTPTGATAPPAASSSSTSPPTTRWPPG